MPIWVKLYNIPLNCWVINSLSMIGSLIGVPIYVDEATTQQNRVSFDRLLIEVDLTKPLVEEVSVQRVSGAMFK